ncbi:hypothetical protein BH23BAC3_BH23BAC3_26340 [soil metagenome]
MKNNRNSIFAFPKTGFWEWDVQTNTIRLSELIFGFLNLSAEHRSITLDEWLELFSQSDRDLIKHEIQTFIKLDGIQPLEFNARIKIAGEDIYVAACRGEVIERDHKKPLRIAGQLQIKHPDSEIKEPVLDDSYLLNLIMDRLPYSIYFKDRKSRFIKISRDCADKFGLSTPGEAIGKTDLDFFDEDHAQQAITDEKNILNTGEPIVGKLEEEGQPGGGGSKKWVSSTKLPIYNNQNKIIGTFGITRDITAQIEAEKALKESEEKYRSIFEIQDVYYRTSRDGIITEISPSIERYSGYKREEVIGSPVNRFYYRQKDRENLIKKLKTDGVVSDFEIRLANKDDKIVHTSISAAIVRDQANEMVGVEGIMRDITERKYAELKLKETHNFYDQLLSSTSEGMYVVDSEYRYIYWNSMMEKISGFKESEILGKKPDELFPHVRQYKILDFIKNALNGKSSKSDDYYFEVEKNSKSGWAQAYYTPLWNKNGQIESALVTISDITHRKVAEEKLRKSDETLRKLSEQVPGTIFQFQQFPDGSSCFPFASTGFANIYEIQPDEVKKSAAKAIDRIYADDLDRVVKSINKSFNSLQYWEMDYRVKLPEKGLRWLRGKARPEKKEDGSVIWHGYITDITNKKQKEHELNKTMDIVVEQNSRLLNFAHIVSHNLRNHAGNISSLLSLYEAENSEEEKMQLLTYLNMASNRLNEAINDLNKIIDQQAGSSKNISRINLFDCFCKIKEILSTEIIVNNVQFDVSIPNDFGIEYNPAYLESILLNLISNAIKYRHPGRTPVIRISLTEENEFGPVLTVSDNGLGINLEKHGTRLFGMYNTFHQNEDSKGIGLYITKNQVESMGGTIEVESEVGSGATFKIVLACDPSRIAHTVQ